jgi:hypothetical protein
MCTYMGKCFSLYAAYCLIALTLAASSGCAQSLQKVTDKPKKSYDVPATLFVNGNYGCGNDSSPGTKEWPLESLKAARDLMRFYKNKGVFPSGGITVYIRAGTYRLTECLELSEIDSGTDQASIVYRPFGNEHVILTGGQEIKSSAFEPVTDLKVLGRMDNAARGKVVQVNLTKQGIKDFGQIMPRGRNASVVPAGLELFFNSEPMTLARWPNTGWTTTSEMLQNKSNSCFTYHNERIKRWSEASDIWVLGYLVYDYTDAYLKVKSIDCNNGLITLAKPFVLPPSQSDPNLVITSGRRFYVSNLLEEIDSPGEWYLDRKSGILYLWPPSAIENASIWVSVLDTPLISMRNTNNVSFCKLTLEGTRGSGVQIVGGKQNQIIGCTLRNIGNVGVVIGEGTDANVVVGPYLGKLYDETMWNRNGGRENGVKDCDIYNTGEGGIILGGGDRKTLSSACNFAANNHIYNFNRLTRTYRPGICVNGVGNRAANNLIENGSGVGILFFGNEHRIELNELCNLCYETGDVSAIYTGRDYTMRGNKVMFNYIHDIHGIINPARYAPATIAIYLDDMASGSTVTGNIIYKAETAMLIGGGRDNVITDNIVVECIQSIFLDARAVGWAKDCIAPGETCLQRLQAVKYSEPPYSEFYPQLATILQDDIGVPKGNIVERNVCFKSPAISIHALAKNDGKVENNFVFEEDPGFGNLNELDLRLKDDSLVYKHIPNFAKIPVDRIGLVISKYRRSLY